MDAVLNLPWWIRRYGMSPRAMTRRPDWIASAQPVTVASPPSPPYDPRDEGGAVLWTDMSDPASFTESGGTITARSNKITAAALTVVASPGYLATGLNGLPTADFLPSYFLDSEAEVAAVGVDSSPLTYACVAALNITDRNEALCGFGNSGFATSRTKRLGQGTSSLGRMLANFTNDAATAVTVNGTIQTDTTPHVYMYVCAGTTIASWIDNVADIPSSAFDPGTLTPNRFAIGSRPDSVPDNSLDGQSSEEWLFDKALSDEARTRVYEYLKAKWGTP